MLGLPTVTNLNHDSVGLMKALVYVFAALGELAWMQLRVSWLFIFPSLLLLAQA